MKEREKRHDTRSEASQDLMKLFDRRGNVKEREISVYYKKGADDLGKTLLKFLSPPDIRNVGLLTWEQPETQDDDQWLYLPADRRVKRITGGSKKNQFMGTDLAYEDLRPEKLSAHEYRVLKEEAFAGHPCWVVEAVPSSPKEKKDSGYGKRLMWIRKDIYFTVHAEFYNHGGRLFKTATFEALVNLKGQIWRSNRSAFKRVFTKTRTITENVSRKINVELAGSLFTQQSLKRPPITY